LIPKFRGWTRRILFIATSALEDNDFILLIIPFCMRSPWTADVFGNKWSGAITPRLSFAKSNLTFEPAEGAIEGNRFEGDVLGGTLP